MTPMRKILSILSFLPALFACGEVAVPVPEVPDGVVLDISLPAMSTRADADNRPEEYNIVDLSLFLTAPGSTEIVYKYVHQSFASIDNTSIRNLKRVTLPLAAGTQPPMDIYVVANCDNAAALQAIVSTDGIAKLQTPSATSAVGLDTEDGLPMYGVLSGIDLDTSTGEAPVVVPLVRTCAKLRVTLTFDDPTWVGTDNTFAVENAAPHTFFPPGRIPVFPSTGLVNYPATGMTATSATTFTGTAYVYESGTRPQIRIRTHAGGTDRQYLASDHFPIPARNYLYDISIRVLKPTSTRGDTPPATDEWPPVEVTVVESVLW